MKRLSIFAILIVLLGSPARPLPADSPAATRDATIAETLKDVSRRGELEGLKWPRFPYYRDELEALYSRSKWRPVWSAEGRPSAAARAAIDALLRAEERGLHPEDYDAALLDRRFRELSATKAAPPRDVAWFDLALSIGVLRHVFDVHLGRVNPKNLSVGINVEPKKLNLVRELREALDRGQVAGMVREVEPRFAQYRSLKSAYARYRVLAAGPAAPPIVAASTVRPGDHFAGAAALRRRLALLGDLSGATSPGDSTAYDSSLAVGVRRFQDRHGLAADGVLGPATLTAINTPLARRKRQLELAMERIRWLPEPDGRFVVVNVPSFELYAFDSLGSAGVPGLSMNVVVGKDQVGRQTPLFERDMRYLVLRPYWVIPRSILKKETLPGLRRDPSYLERNDMEVYSGSGDDGPALPANADNIARVGRGELGIRQRPGPKNSLGLAKFIFPNDANVYMHGTPATELFSRTRRDFSHGCIRLEDPARFAVWVLRDPAKWPAAEVQRAMAADTPRRVNLGRPLPVLIYYTTAVVRPDGVVAFYDDVYRHDAQLEATLAKGYPFAP